MYLSRLVIKNFRSIKDLDVEFFEGKNVIVGRNNAGKSNIVKALNIVLGENSPTYDKSENITLSDFYTHKSDADNHLELSENIYIACFLKRTIGEDLNFTEINKCMGYFKLLQSQRGEEQRVQINSFNDSELEKIFILDHECQDVSDPAYVIGKHWVDSKLRNQIKFEDELSDKNEFVLVFNANRVDDNIKKTLRFLYREDEGNDWVLGFNCPIRNELLQSAIIPSFRDPDSQLRLNTWTWYGKLMRSLTHGDHPELKDAFDKVTIESNKIFESVQTKIKDEALDMAFPDTEIYFQFSEEKNQEIYKNTKIFIDDGIKTELSNKGAGIQSATIIGLFNYYTKYVNLKTSSLLCIEEPELYLHPHARRVISDKLDDFSKNSEGELQHQVILTTHSSEFVRTTDETLNIILVRKGLTGTTGSKIRIRQLKELLIDERYGEAFFADKVVLCEGLDGYLLKWVADEKFTGAINSKNVSILNIGSKDLFRKFAKLILDAGIECYLFCDFDFILRDEKPEAQKYKTKDRSPSHKSLYDMEKRFFAQEKIFNTNADNEIEKLRSMREQLKTSSEKDFYCAKTVFDLPNNQSFLETTERFRKNGIGILNGEIENLSKDQNILAPQKIKLSLDKIFEINGELNQGKSISDLIETKEIVEFLTKVLS